MSSSSSSRRAPKQSVGEALGVADGEALLQRAAQTTALDAAFRAVRPSLVDGTVTLDDILRLPATATNQRKVEQLLHVADAQAKLITDAAHAVERDLFPKCVIAKAEAHARELKARDRERRQRSRAKKRAHESLEASPPPPNSGDGTSANKRATDDARSSHTDLAPGAERSNGEDHYDDDDDDDVGDHGNDCDEQGIDAEQNADDDARDVVSEQYEETMV